MEKKEYRGKGIGSFSWKFITKHAFEMINLIEVYAYIFEDNISSRKCAEKSGYIQESKLLIITIEMVDTKIVLFIPK